MCRHAIDGARDRTGTPVKQAATEGREVRHDTYLGALGRPAQDFGLVTQSDGTLRACTVFCR